MLSNALAAPLVLNGEGGGRSQAQCRALGFLDVLSGHQVPWLLVKSLGCQGLRLTSTGEDFSRNPGFHDNWLRSKQQLQLSITAVGSSQRDPP